MHTHALSPRGLLLALLLLPLLPGPSSATAEDAAATRAVQLLSSYALTPDGRTLVLSWRGDLWRVPVTGGAAHRLTWHPASDRQPEVSPDGRRVAFVSDRSGSAQVHVMPLTGGRPEQVTLHTEGFRLYGWFPSGEALLVRARLDHGYRRADRFFRRPLDPDAPLELLFDAQGGSGTLSPDGRSLAFVREGVGWARKEYQGSQAGQIWIYDFDAGTFEKLTSGDHGERSPLWSADGKQLLVVSQEDGTFNLWRIDRGTGARTQLTHFEDDGVLFPALSADGKTLVFRRRFDLYRLDVEAGTEAVKIEIRDVGDPTVDPILHRTVSKATAVAFTDDAREIAFIAGGDLWVMDTELREPRRITNTPEEEGEPLFSPDFETLYFVSGRDGRPDIWVARRADPKRWWWQNDEFQLEKITDDDVTQWGISWMPDGKRLVYLQGLGDLWTMKPDGSDRTRHLESWNAPWYSFSPDGKWIAYAVQDDDFNRDVWIRPLDGSRDPFNLSRHPDTDGSPTWSPDGKILAFTGRRWREEQDICYVYLRKEDEEQGRRDRKLEKAIEKMKGRKAKGKKKPAEPAAKKDAPKKDEPAAGTDPVAGTWRGRITGAPPLPADGMPAVLVVMRGREGALTARISIVDEFSGPLENLEVEENGASMRFTLQTPYGPLQGEATIDGDRLTGSWKIEGVMVGEMEFTRDAPPKAEDDDPAEPKKPAKSKKKKESEPTRIDFDGLEDRIHRISIPNATESRLVWSPDSKKLAFQTSVGGSRGLYTVSFPDSLTPKRLTSTTGTWGRWLKDGNRIAWLVSGTPATMTASGKATSYSFRVNQAIDLAARHGAAFDAAWRVMRDEYYDGRLNGRDWDAIRARYLPVAARSVTPEELEQVVTMMLGELNGSHLGFNATSKRWSKPGWREVTRHLGVRFDDTHEGEGLKIRDVIPGTPAAQERQRLAPGEVIRSIDGQAVGPGTRLARVLTGPADVPVRLEVAGEDGKTRTVELRATSYGSARAQLYDVWLEHERETVERLGKGRLGYLHVRGMNWSSFERFEAELVKVGHGRDGLIIDVRDNGGGFTTDHLLTVLTQPRHAITVPRGGGPGYPQDRLVYARWDKPVVVLCNQNSFSNAEIFSHAVQTLGRGPIVGTPTAGGVISTGRTSILDVGFLRLPFRGWFHLETGEDMEKNGCVPDHVVWPLPGELPAGRDRQLEKAVEVLGAEVEAYAKQKRPRLRYASERSTTDSR